MTLRVPCFGNIILIFIAALSCPVVMAQRGITDLNRQLFYENREYPAHSAFKPYLSENVKPFTDIISAKPVGKVANALFYSDLLSYDNRQGVEFRVNVLVNAEGGREMADPLYQDTFFYNNTRGFKIEANLGSKLTFQTAFYENQTRYLPYIDAYVRETGASVGMGRTKVFKATGHDYAMATGMLVYRPLKAVELWFGHGKNFVGNGYRSLFLSDHTASYPHLRVNVKLFSEKLQYTAVMATLLSSNRLRRSSTGEAPLIRKAANFNYLSFAPSEKLEIGLFESILWNKLKGDAMVSAPAMRYNPLILLNTANEGLDGRNNASVGVNVCFRPVASLSFYGQALMDGSNKNGWQLGVLKRDLLLPNLYVQVEYNRVRPYTYTAQDSLSHYTQLNQALAHPLGAGFGEVVTVLNYRYKRVMVDFLASSAKFDLPYGTPGQNLAKPVVPGNSGNSDRFFARAALGYIINPVTNLQVKGGFMRRKLNPGSGAQQASFVFVALTSNLNNLYFDF